MDPGEDPEDTLRAHRSRERTFIFDTVFDQHASQVHSTPSASNSRNTRAQVLGFFMSARLRLSLRSKGGCGEKTHPRDQANVVLLWTPVTRSHCLLWGPSLEFVHLFLHCTC